MKAFGLLFVPALILALTTSGQAQTARQLTRKIVPPPPAPARPPAAPPAATPATPATPAAPVDPEKEKAKQDEALKKTIEFQKKRAEGGSDSAQYDLGIRYLFGDGVEKDPETGRKWIVKSAAQDYAPAKKKLADLDKIDKK